MLRLTAALPAAFRLIGSTMSFGGRLIADEQWILLLLIAAINRTPEPKPEPIRQRGLPSAAL